MASLARVYRDVCKERPREYWDCKSQCCRVPQQTEILHCWTLLSVVQWFPFCKLPQTLFFHHAAPPNIVQRWRQTPFFSNLGPFPILCHTRSQWFVSNVWFPQLTSFFVSFFYFFLPFQRWEPSSHVGLPRRLRSHQKNRKRQIFRSIWWYECGEQRKVCR